jgi:hypothetical protein
MGANASAEALLPRRCCGPAWLAEGPWEEPATKKASTPPNRFDPEEAPIGMAAEDRRALSARKSVTAIVGTIEVEATEATGAPATTTRRQLMAEEDEAFIPATVEDADREALSTRRAQGASVKDLLGKIESGKQLAYAQSLP